MTLQHATSLRLKEILDEKNITSYRLSRISGVSEGTIADIRLERNKSVSLRVIYDLMSALDEDMKYFFDTPLFGRENIDD